MLRLYSVFGGNFCPRGYSYRNGADEDPQDEMKSDACQRKWSEVERGMRIAAAGRLCGVN